MAIALRISDREYTDYTLQMVQTNETWVALAGDDEFAEFQAREFFWQKVKDTVLAEVSRLGLDDWELAEEVGPETIKLRKSQKVEFGVQPSDILLWFMTLGVALIIQLFLNSPRRYVIYKPVQVRIRMSRLKQHEMVRAA